MKIFTCAALLIFGFLPITASAEDNLKNWPETEKLVDYLVEKKDGEIKRNTKRPALLAIINAYPNLKKVEMETKAEIKNINEVAVFNLMAACAACAQCIDGNAKNYQLWKSKKGKKYTEPCARCGATGKIKGFDCTDCCGTGKKLFLKKAGISVKYPEFFKRKMDAIADVHKQIKYIFVRYIAACANGEKTDYAALDAAISKIMNSAAHDFMDQEPARNCDNFAAKAELSDKKNN